MSDGNKSGEVRDVKLNVKFHQGRFLSICNSNGYLVYEMDENSFLNKTNMEGNTKTKFIELIYDKPIIAIVKEDAPGVLELQNTATNTIDKKFFSDPIVACKSFKEKFIVCLKTCILMYKLGLEDEKLGRCLKVIAISPNPNGICTLNSRYLAYPQSSTNGIIEVLDARDYVIKLTIQAYHKPLSALAFSPDGRSLATASTVGSIVRIFSLMTGKQTFEFKTGRYFVTITSLVFSRCSKFIACSIDGETVRIFQLDPVNGSEKKTPESSVTRYMLSFLPEILTSRYFENDATYSIDLSEYGHKRIVLEFTEVRNKVNLFAVTDDGWFHRYLVEGVQGEALSILMEDKLYLPQQSRETILIPSSL